MPVLKDLVAVAGEHNLPEYGGSTRSMLRMIAYYSDEPDAFADFGPCLAAEYSDRVQAEMTPERTGDLGQRALQVAEEHPETKTARAGLVWAVLMGWRGDEIPAIAKVGERARERLQERYPDSLENLMVQFRHLNSQKRWDEAIPLF